ncbi:acyl-CoA dehydrogenase [Streptomyces stackebrandtii]|uniref:acyl-CoA dehydrogenase n=1 Tax=Streptomyces stackebrandtii TaxID=3051177 RepID=UPI0028DC20DD|nr:acyl-CoA dehydrogenase [Streptomyces sp. DSM 40976]
MPVGVPVGARIDAVEAALGDPRDPANPVGWAAVLAADEQRVLPPAGVALYDRLGLNAEFVPASLGGRLCGTDELGPVLRALFRRDAALGVGSALTSFMAATAVWAFGDDTQRARTAEVLLAGGRATIAYHRFAHGNEFVSDELRARRTPDGFLLDGRKRAVHNAQDARLVVAFARTGEGDEGDEGYEGDEADESGGGHSLFLLDRAALTGPRVRRGETRRAAGMRGLHVGSLEFTERPLPRTALLGSWGDGVRHSLSVFPLIHAAVPSMVIGVSDTALRTAALYATEQRPFSRPLPQVSYARTAVAGAFADLLLADALARTAARALHLLPGGSPVLAAAAKYLVPAGVEENLNALSVILGGAFHARDGAYAILQKHVRDFPTVTFGHVGNVVCQTVMAQHLGWIGSGRWTGEAPPPAVLFRPGPVLPPLDPAVFTAADGRDGLCVLLAEAPGEPRLAGTDPVLRTLRAQLGLLAAETVRLQEACDGLGRFGAGPYPSRVFPLTDRYALLLAAAAGFGVWRESAPDARAADPGWLAVALHRVLRRLGRAAPPLPAGVEAALCEEVLRRAAEARSYDLDDRVLAG